jgi:hypothetical protein
MATNETIGQTNVSFGNYISAAPTKFGAKLHITTIEDGYTPLKIYGKESQRVAFGVPVYQMHLYDSDMNHHYTYYVTRDSWYCLGYDSGYYYYTNRCFNPGNPKQNLYTGKIWEYPAQLKALWLHQLGSDNLLAEPRKQEYNVYLNGTPINAARTDLNKATQVMIHVGGWYYNYDINKKSLAGSYGCFGVVPGKQVYSTLDNAVASARSGKYKREAISNDYQNKFMSNVKRFANGKPIHVVIDFLDQIKLEKIEEIKELEKS